MNHTHEDLGMGTHLYITHRPLTARAKRSRIPTRENARKEEHLPMYRLWAAMISQAIEDIRNREAAKRQGSPVCRYDESVSVFSQRKCLYNQAMTDGDQAERWMAGRSLSKLKFADLCTALNLSADAIRAKLRKEIHA